VSAWDGVERRRQPRRKDSGMDPENCPVGVKHEAEIQALKQATNLVASDVKEIKERLLGRPSWSVTVIIAFLSTLAFSALTFAFTVIKEVSKWGLLK
jgi:hypothetical protein